MAACAVVAPVPPPAICTTPEPLITAVPFTISTLSQPLPMLSADEVITPAPASVRLPSFKPFTRSVPVVFVAVKGSASITL